MVKLSKLVMRNTHTREGGKAKKDLVNLEYYRDDVNLGDYLSLVITSEMLRKKGLSFDAKANKKYTHLMAVGSILGGRGYFDATVWGSGVRSFSEVAALGVMRKFQKLDIRAVRGPVTRQILSQAGKQKCPEVYGDPGVLLPLIYPKSKENNSSKIGLITHYLSKVTIPKQYEDKIIHIDICTKDYQAFVDKMMQCDRIISSSLHGIILAESYGIPAVFLGCQREGELLKYYDWYLSTGRSDFPIAQSLEQALDTKAPSLPDLQAMQQGLIDAFPYDLWQKND